MYVGALLALLCIILVHIHIIGHYTLTRSRYWALYLYTFPLLGIMFVHIHIKTNRVELQQQIMQINKK